MRSGTVSWEQRSLVRSHFQSLPLSRVLFCCFPKWLKKGRKTTLTLDRYGVCRILPPRQKLQGVSPLTASTAPPAVRRNCGSLYGRTDKGSHSLRWYLAHSN